MTARCHLCSAFGRDTPAVVTATVAMAGERPRYPLCVDCHEEIEAYAEDVELIEGAPDAPSDDDRPMTSGEVAWVRAQRQVAGYVTTLDPARWPIVETEWGNDPETGAPQVLTVHACTCTFDDCEGGPEDEPWDPEVGGCQYCHLLPGGVPCPRTGEA